MSDTRNDKDLRDRSWAFVFELEEIIKDISSYNLVMDISSNTERIDQAREELKKILEKWGK